MILWSILYFIVVSLNLNFEDQCFLRFHIFFLCSTLLFLTYGRINLLRFEERKLSEKKRKICFELILSIQPIVSITHLVLLRVKLFRRNMIWKEKNEMSDREFSSISFLRRFVAHLIRFTIKCWPSNALLNFAASF